MSKILQGVLCLLLGFFLSAPKTAQAQFEVHPDSSFYTLQDSFYHYYQDDSTEGGIYNKMRRTSMIWGQRLAPDGKMSRANKAMLNYTRTYKNIPVGGPNGLPVPVVLPSVYPTPISWGELGHLNPLLGTGNAVNAKGMGQIQRLAFHPNYDGTTNQIIYAGSHYGGLYRTDNDGGQWYNYYTDRGLSMTSIGDVAASPNYVFVCTGNGDHASSAFGAQADYAPIRGNLNDFSPLHTQGVYRNTHSGSTTWISINGNAPNSVTMVDGSTKNDLLDVFALGGTMRRIIVHPSNENILLIATSQGVFRTGNGGATWQQVIVGPPNGTGGYIWEAAWRGLEFHPTNPDTVYASAKDVYRSVDGGLTWASMTNNQGLQLGTKRTNIAVTPAAPGRVYAYAIGWAGYVFLYENGTWTAKGIAADVQKDWLGIAVSPVHPNVVHLAGLRIQGTHTFNATTVNYVPVNTGGIHDDIHFLGYPPNGDTTLFAGTHGGVSKSTISATTNTPWVNLYNGLGVTMIYSFDDWEGDDSLLITANQDIGINYSYDRGENWYSKGGGDGYGVRVNDQTAMAYIRTNNYDGLYKLYPHLSRISIQDPILLSLLSATPNDGIAGNAIVPNTFPGVNHPKNELFYLGFSELYLRKRDTLSTDDVVYNPTVITTVITGPKFNSQGVMTSPGDPNTCFLRGGTVINTQGGLLGNGGWYIDSVCEEIINIPDYAQVERDLWAIKSHLKAYQSKQDNRRILEMAFSEDDSTNYTYLVTLGDFGWRRCDLYFNDKDATGCDTCFALKTANLPYDATIPGQTTYDPNPVTGIAVDPLNGNRVWVTFSGYSKDLKVWYSDDAGGSWTSYDDGDGSLAGLNLPINGIVYQRGTNDRLYIATDAGIYVREGQGNWLRYGEEFPNVRVTELKINYCVGKLRAATFGRGMWEADLLPAEDNIAFRSFRSVNANETWTTNKNMSRDIRVKAGVTLTLNNMTLNMPKNGLIVVEPGGQLVVDSSTITNLCGQTWQGIEVWGATQNSQAPYNQGFLYITNSTVEHAREAVRLWKVGDYPNATSTTGGTGGIVLAGNTQFLNNWRSAEFMKYRSTNRYLSEFSDCTFEVNEDMRQDFLGHISAWDVGGLQIKGCDFRDTRSQKQDDAYGILTLSASVQLTAWQNGVNFQRNSFEGLSRGVVLGGTPNQFSTVVDQTDFTDNNRGVIVRASGGLKIIRNTFEVGNHPSNNDSYGLSILRQGDFIAEQNDFASSTNLPSGRPTLGLWIDDLGSGFNRIRNNTFTRLALANLAHGNSGADANNFQGGLRYFCNGQTGNAFDITVNGAYQAPTGAAIATDQGDIGQPAYNSFSYPLNNYFGTDWHMSNDASLLSNINYWVPPNPLNLPTAEEPIDVINITPIRALSNGNSTFCDLIYTNLGIFKPLGSNGDIATLADLKTAYYQYWDEYQQLLEAYQNDPTSTTLPSEIGGKGQALTSKANEVIFYYRNDTTDNNWDSIAVWIGHKVGLSAEYELIEHYWSGARYEEALSHLSTITDVYTLEDVVLNNHQEYEALLNMLYTAYQADRTEATLTKDEVILLNELAENNNGFASMKAANIVDFFYSDTYRYHPTLPEQGQEEKSLQLPLTKLEKGNLSIYPNPTTDWADVRYKLPEGIEKGQLIVTSTAGQQMMTLSVQGQQGIVTLNTSEWLTGTYFVVLYTDEKAIEQTQLIIR